MGETDLYPCIPLEMSADRLDDLVDKAKTYALMHGNYFSFSFVKDGDFNFFMEILWRFYFAFLLMEI